MVYLQFNIINSPHIENWKCNRLLIRIIIIKVCTKNKFYPFSMATSTVGIDKKKIYVIKTTPIYRALIL